MTKRLPFKYFKTFPEIIRLAVMLYVRFPLSLRNAEDLLHERDIDGQRNPDDCAMRAVSFGIRVGAAMYQTSVLKSQERNLAIQ